MNFFGTSKQPERTLPQPTTSADDGPPVTVARANSNLDLCSVNNDGPAREIGISESTAEVVSVLTDADFHHHHHHHHVVTATPSSSVPTMVGNASTALDVIQEALSVGSVATQQDSNIPSANFVYQTPPRPSSWNKPVMGTPSSSDTVQQQHQRQQQQQQLVTPAPVLHSSIIGHIHSSGGRRSNKTLSSNSSASSTSPYTLNPLTTNDWQQAQKSLQVPLLDQTSTMDGLVKRLQQGFRVKVHDSVSTMAASHHRAHLYLHADRKRLFLRGCEEEKKEDEQVDSWEEIAISSIVKLEFGRKVRHTAFNPLKCFSIAVEEPQRPYGAGLRFYDFEAGSAEEREVIVSTLIMVLESSSADSSFPMIREKPPSTMPVTAMPINPPRTPPSTSSSRLPPPTMRRGVSLNGHQGLHSRPSSSRGGTRDQPILCSPSLMEEAAPTFLESRRQFHEQKKAAALLKRPQLSPLQRTQIFNASHHAETSLAIHGIEEVVDEETSEQKISAIVPSQADSEKRVTTVQAVTPSKNININSNNNPKKTYSGSQIIQSIVHAVQPVEMATAANSSLFPVVEASLAVDVYPSRTTIADVVGEPAKEEYVLLLSETSDANRLIKGDYASSYDMYKYTRVENVHANDMGDSKGDPSLANDSATPIPGSNLGPNELIATNGFISPISAQSSQPGQQAFAVVPHSSRTHLPDSHDPNIPDKSRPTVVAKPRNQPGNTRTETYPQSQGSSHGLSLERTRQEAHRPQNTGTWQEPYTVPTGKSRQETHSSAQVSGSSRSGSNAFPPSINTPESYGTQPEPFVVPVTSTQSETYVLSYTLPDCARREPHAMPSASRPEVYEVHDASIPESYATRGRSRPQSQVHVKHTRVQEEHIQSVSTDRRSPLLGNAARESRPANSSIKSVDYSGNHNSTGNGQQKVANDSLRHTIPPPEIKRNSSSTSESLNYNASPPTTMASLERQISGGCAAADPAVSNRQRLPSNDYSTKSNSTQNSHTRKATTPDTAVMEVSYNTYVERNFAQPIANVHDPTGPGQPSESGRFERGIGQKQAVDSEQKQQQSYQYHMGQRQSTFARPMEQHQSHYEPKVVQAVQRKPSFDRDTRQRQSGFERREEELKSASHSHPEKDNAKMEHSLPPYDPIEHSQPKEQRQPSHERNMDQTPRVANSQLTDEQRSGDQRQHTRHSFEREPRYERNQRTFQRNGGLRQNQNRSTSRRSQPFRSSGDPLSLFNPDSFQLSRESIPELEPIDRPIKKAAVIEIRKPIIDVELLQANDYTGIPQKYAIVERKPIIDVTSLSPSATQNFDHVGTGGSYQLTGGWCAEDFCTTTLNDMANTCSGIFAIEQVKHAQAQVSCFDPTLTDQQMLMIEEYITSALGAPSAMYSFLTEGDSVWDTGLPGNHRQPPQQKQQQEDMASSRVRNRATQTNAQAHRMRKLRNEMTFAAALKQSKARMHVIRTTQSFDDAKLPQMADKVAKEFHASALLNMLVKNMMAHNRQEKPATEEEEEIAFYDSDPEDSRPRTLHQGPRRVSAERRNQAEGKVKHQRALSGIGLDNVGARLGRKMDEHAIVEIVQAMVNERLTLMWHPTQCKDQPNRAPILTRVWIEAGVHLLDGTFLLPKLTWTKAYEDDKSQQFRAELHKVDLLDICRIRATEKVDRTLHPFANRRLSFVIETQSKLFLFEAETMKERDRIVSGLKVVVARLASLLMLRDIRAADEFFGAPVVPGESPQWTSKNA